MTGDVTDEYLHQLEARRNDAAKQASEAKRKGIVSADALEAKRRDAAVGL